MNSTSDTYTHDGAMTPFLDANGRASTQHAEEQHKTEAHRSVTLHQPSEAELVAEFEDMIRRCRHDQGRPNVTFALRSAHGRQSIEVTFSTPTVQDTRELEADVQTVMPSTRDQQQLDLFPTGSLPVGRSVTVQSEPRRDQDHQERVSEVTDIVSGSRETPPESEFDRSSRMGADTIPLAALRHGDRSTFSRTSLIDSLRRLQRINAQTHQDKMTAHHEPEFANGNSHRGSQQGGNQVHSRGMFQQEPEKNRRHSTRGRRDERAYHPVPGQKNGVGSRYKPMRAQAAQDMAPWPESRKSGKGMLKGQARADTDPPPNGDCSMCGEQGHISADCAKPNAKSSDFK